MFSEKPYLPQKLAQQAMDILASTNASKEHFGTRIEYLRTKIEQWNRAKWRVGLIGITSSGKSTLVNGLLGEKLLPAHVRPSSNCMIITSRGEPKRVIKYYTNGDIKQVSTNLSDELDRLGNELNNPSNTENVMHLEVFSPVFKLNGSIELCDTPGLDAYNLPQHDEITLNSVLPTLDLVLYVSTIRLVAQENSQIVKLVTDKNKPLIWVLNCSDIIQEKTRKDGLVSKSRQEVANEYLEKIRQNLSESGIGEFSSIPVLFVSSFQSLQPEQYGESGFIELVQTIHDEVSRLSPKFVQGRLTQLLRELDELIKEEKSVGPDDKPDYASIKEELGKTVGELESTRNDYIDEFRKIQDGYEENAKKILGELDSITKSSINQANELQKRTTQIAGHANHLLNELILKMNTKVREIRKSLNIRQEDLRLMPGINVPSIPNESVVIETKTITTREERPKILGLGIRKKIDNILGTRLSYYTYTKEIDEIKNLGEFKERRIEGPLVMESKWLSDNIEKALDTIDHYSQIIGGVLQSRDESLDEALKHTISPEEKDHILHALSDLTYMIKTHIDTSPQASSDTSINPSSHFPSSGEEASEHYIDSLEYRLMKFLNAISNNIFQLRLEEVIHFDKSQKSPQVIICHWNQDTFRDFWSRYFPQLPTPEGQYSRIKHDVYDIAVIDDSIKGLEGYYSKVENIDWANSTAFLLLTVSQIGHTQKQYFNSSLTKHIKKTSNLVAVVADFADFFEQDNLVDYLLEFQNLIQEAELAPKHIILNHDDLGLGNMIERLIRGSSKVNNAPDDVAFIAEMDELGYFVNDEMKNKIANLLREWRSATNVE